MKLKFDTKGNDKQKECAACWLNDSINDIVYGGSKGSGKSFLGVNLIFGDAFIYPGTHYFIARKKLNDIRKFTIPSIHEVFDMWGITPDYYKYNGQDNYYELVNGSRIYLLEAKYLPSDPEYYRFGSMQMTRGWIEEAGEFEESAKSNLMASVGRWKNNEYSLSAKLLQTCNPSKNYLYRAYYKPSKAGTLEPYKRFIQALPTDNKMLADGYLLNLERSLNKNEKKRLLHGNWEYDDDPAALIDYEKILNIFTNTHVPGGRRNITCDVARFGKDKTITIEWDGWRGYVRKFSKQDTAKTATVLDSSRIRIGASKSDVLVDEDGIGGGIVDFYKCKGFVNNSKALPSPDGVINQDGKVVPENFDNLKSQCYFRLAKRINEGGVYLELEDEADRDLIIEELEAVKQKHLDSDMKKGVIPKDKVKELIGRSPDFSDCLMMNEFNYLIPEAWPAFI
jgi:phage terminase large subunit